MNTQQELFNNFVFTIYISSNAGENKEFNI